jgi:hypothetical protein
MFIVPFDSDNLRKIITGEIDSPKIDYVNSKIKGKNFITYFSNLKYKNIDIDFSEVSTEEKCVLLTEFIKHQSCVHIEQFEATLLKALFHYKGFKLDLVDKSDLDAPFLSKAILTNDEIVEYVKTNNALMTEVIDILDGTLLYAIKNLSAYKEQLGDHITNNIVVDKVEVGKTFVNLYSNETFNSYYYSNLPDFGKLKYFEHYFDRPIYSGQQLISFISKDCVLFPLLKMVMDQTFSAEQLKQICEEADVTLI